MKEFGFYSPKNLIASLFFALFVYDLVPSEMHAAGKKDTTEEIFDGEVLRGGHAATLPSENAENKERALVTGKAPDMGTAEQTKDVDKGHPLRCLPQEILYMILMKLNIAEAKNFYLAIAGWKDQDIRDGVLDFTLEDDFDRLTIGFEQHWKQKMGSSAGFEEIAHKWKETRTLGFGSQQREKTRRAIIARLEVCKPKDRFVYWWYHEHIYPHLIPFGPDGEAKKKLVMLHIEKVFGWDISHLPYPICTYEAVREVLNELIKAEYEAIPLLIQLIPVLRSDDHFIPAGRLAELSQRSLSVLKTYFTLMKEYNLAWDVFRFQALDMIPENFDLALLRQVDEKIGISHETASKVLSLSAQEVGSRINLVVGLASQLASTGVDDDSVSLLKKKIFSLDRDENIEQKANALLGQGGILLSPAMVDIISRIYEGVPDFEGWPMDYKWAETIGFLVAKDPEEIHSIGESCQMERERQLLSRSLMVGGLSTTTTVLCTVISVMIVRDLIVGTISVLSYFI